MRCYPKRVAFLLSGTFLETKMSQWKAHAALNTSICRKAVFIWQERMSLIKKAAAQTV